MGWILLAGLLVIVFVAAQLVSALGDIDNYLWGLVIVILGLGALWILVSALRYAWDHPL